MENMESEGAIAEFTRAIEVYPTYELPSASEPRPETPHDFPRTVEDYAEAARRAPEDAESHRALAWILATCISPEVRRYPCRS